MGSRHTVSHLENNSHSYFVSLIKAQRTGTKNHHKFLTLPDLFLRDDTQKAGDSASPLFPHQVPRASPPALSWMPSPCVETNPARSNRRTSLQSPSPGSQPPGAGSPGGSPGYEDKEGTHRQPGVACSLSSLSLLSSVTVKRHRGCNCHLCRRCPPPQSQSEPGACSACLPAASPPAVVSCSSHPRPGPEGWKGQSRT